MPISATKFDNEDSDFASGLSLCLTRDGQGAPTTALTWSQRLTLNGATGTSPLTVGCTGGSNNPALQTEVLDGSGVTLNLTTPQAIALAIQGTNVLSVNSSSVTAAQPLTAPSLIPSSATVPANGIYLPAANQVGVAIASANAATFSGTGLVLAGALSASTLAASAGGSSIKGALTIGAPASAGYSLAITAGNGASSCVSIAGGAGINASMEFAGNGNSIGTASLFLGQGSDGTAYLYQRANLPLKFATNSTVYAQLLANGQFQAADDGGTFQTIGWRGTPYNVQAGNYTAVLADRGKCIQLTGAGGTLTVPANVFSQGDVLSVEAFNGNFAFTISAGTGLTLYWATGSGAVSGNRTLTSVGLAAISFVNATTAVISGSGLS